MMVGAKTRSLTFSISLLLVGLAVGWISLAVDRLLGLQQVFPYPINLSGLVLIIIGTSLRFWAGSVFYQVNQSMVSFQVPPNFVTTGPWKYSRNPLYLGLIIMGLGFSLLFSSYTDLTFTVIGAVLLHLEVTLHEEKVLDQKFGYAYQAYKSKVRKWI